MRSIAAVRRRTQRRDSGHGCRNTSHPVDGAGVVAAVALSGQTCSDKPQSPLNRGQRQMVLWSLFAAVHRLRRIPRILPSGSLKFLAGWKRQSRCKCGHHSLCHQVANCPRNPLINPGRTAGSSGDDFIRTNDYRYRHLSRDKNSVLLVTSLLSFKVQTASTVSSLQMTAGTQACIH